MTDPLCVRRPPRWSPGSEGRVSAWAGGGETAPERPLGGNLRNLLNTKGLTKAVCLWPTLPGKSGFGYKGGGKPFKRNSLRVKLMHRV